MFIVCPSCSGPYRIPAEQIAPLVQTACPHCEYRIILDFEAANEPSLREAGHQFAQGFESVEAYASVYDHVTSKPDAQPRLGVTAVTAQSAGQAVGQAAGLAAGQAAQAQAAVGQSAAASARAPTPTPVAATARPLQQRSDPAPAATPAATSVRSAGSKTVLQVPSKKPVSMDAAGTPLATGSASSSTAAPSMRAGKGVDVVDPVEAQDAAAERKPPHTPPVASVVSSGPAPSEQPTPPPEDIAAQSGPHKVETKPADIKPADKPADRPADKPAAKPAAKPAEPAGSSTIYIIIVALIVAALVAVVLLNR